jgi:hypothetical protein
VVLTGTGTSLPSINITLHARVLRYASKEIPLTGPCNPGRHYGPLNFQGTGSEARS